jgi:Amt family ammonium transporter
MAASAGCLTAALVSYLALGKPDLSMILNGTLAGLVAVTAGCNSVSVPGSVVIGIIGGVLVVYAVLFFDWLRIDDPVGALSVHLVNGVFGTAAVGLFSVKGGLFYGGGFHLLGVQLLGIAAIGAFVGATSAIAWLALRATIGIRVTVEEERSGLDVGEHGMEAYPGFAQISPEPGMMDIT